MLHASLVVDRLVVGGRELAVDHATVVVVARAESAELDWEVVAHTSQVEPLARGPRQLRLSSVGTEAGEVDARGEASDLDEVRLVRLVARDLQGPAFLVRAVERAVVFRGTGPLDGFDLGRLRG